LLDRGGYSLYDINGKVIKEVSEKNQASTNTTDTKGFDLLTLTHMQNFINGIRISEPLHSPIHEASVSTLLCHLGNIAQFEHKSLEIDNTNGHILNNQAAVSKHWKREYERGWEPVL
jgi:hypothetical protein